MNNKTLNKYIEDKNKFILKNLIKHKLSSFFNNFVELLNSKIYELTFKN